MTDIGEAPAPHVDAVFSIQNQLVTWLRDVALPVWDEHGVDRLHGGYHENIASPGMIPVGDIRRGRVVARQIYVFDLGHRLGWRSTRSDPVRHGIDFLFAHLHRGDGRFHTAVEPVTHRAAGSFSLYEQAFYLFALARLAPSEPSHPVEDIALRCLARLRQELGKADGGFEESSPPTLPLKSNPHMHLLEAALEWIGSCAAVHRHGWVALAQELVRLCLTRFVDARTGAVREYFGYDWEALQDDERGQIVEPGHQFEWAWLLMRWRSSGHCDSAERAVCAKAAARMLDVGESRGVDPVRGVAINELWDDLTVKDPDAKLWPQTERVKAWCAMLADAGTPADADLACMKIAAAAHGLAQYVPGSLAGLWHESWAADGKFVPGPSKASSFYHVACAIDVLRQTVEAHRP